MTTYIFDKRLGKVVEKRGDNFAFQHYIICDTMPDRLLHPVTGKYHDSKSKFRQDTKAAGCEEVGNEKMETKRTPIDGEKRRSVLRDQLRTMSDSQAGEIMSQLERQYRR